MLKWILSSSSLYWLNTLDSPVTQKIVLNGQRIAPHNQSIMYLYQLSVKHVLTWYIYIYIYMCVCVCIIVCMYVCLCVCVYVCMYVCIYLSIYKFSLTLTWCTVYSFPMPSILTANHLPFYITGLITCHKRAIIHYFNMTIFWRNKIWATSSYRI